MARSVRYCIENDAKRLLGMVSLSPTIVVVDYCDDAGDEIDAAIGQRYVIPIQVSLVDPAKRHGSLLLKTINAQLAAGRLLTSIASPGSSDKTQAYGKYLIERALKVLQKIVDGELDIPWAEVPEGTASSVNGPILVGGDAFSHVDQYYQNQFPAGFMPGRTPTEDPWPAPGWA